MVSGLGEQSLQVSCGHSWYPRKIKILFQTTYPFNGRYGNTYSVKYRFVIYLKSFHVRFNDDTYNLRSLLQAVVLLFKAYVSPCISLNQLQSKQKPAVKVNTEKISTAQKNVMLFSLLYLEKTYLYFFLIFIRYCSRVWEIS